MCKESTQEVIQWISVRDQLPEPSYNVLVYVWHDDGGSCLQKGVHEGRYKDRDWYYPDGKTWIIPEQQNYGSHQILHVSHWAFKPRGPKHRQ